MIWRGWWEIATCIRERPRIVRRVSETKMPKKGCDDPRVLDVDIPDAGVADDEEGAPTRP